MREINIETVLDTIFHQIQGLAKIHKLIKHWILARGLQAFSCFSSGSINWYNSYRGQFTCFYQMSSEHNVEISILGIYSTDTLSYVNHDIYIALWFIVAKDLEICQWYIK